MQALGRPAPPRAVRPRHRPDQRRASRTAARASAARSTTSACSAEELADKDQDVTAFVDSSNAVLAVLRQPGGLDPGRPARAARHAAARPTARSTAPTSSRSNRCPALRDSLPGRPGAEARAARRCSPFFRADGGADPRPDPALHAPGVRRPSTTCARPPRGSARPRRRSRTRFTRLNQGLNALAYNPPGDQRGLPLLPALAQPQLNNLFAAPGRARAAAARASCMLTCSTANLAEGTGRRDAPVPQDAAAAVNQTQPDRRDRRSADGTARPHHRRRSPSPSPSPSPASACCSSSGAPSAARSRSSPRATGSRSRSTRRPSSRSSPTSGSPTSRSARSRRSSSATRARTATSRSPRSRSTNRYAPIPEDTRAILRAEDAARRDLRRAHPGRRTTARSVPEGGSLPPAQVSDVGAARRDLPHLRRAAPAPPSRPGCSRRRSRSTGRGCRPLGGDRQPRAVRRATPTGCCASSTPRRSPSSSSSRTRASSSRRCQRAPGPAPGPDPELQHRLRDDRARATRTCARPSRPCPTFLDESRLTLNRLDELLHQHQPADHPAAARGAESSARPCARSPG